MHAVSLSPSPTNPEITQTMAPLDVTTLDLDVVRPQRRALPANFTRPDVRREPIAKATLVQGPAWHSWLIAAMLTVLATAVAFWATSTPRFEVRGQPLGLGQSVVVMLQGAEQPAAVFDRQVKEMLVNMPEATVVMANAPHTSQRGTRWVLGPNWSDVTRTKDESYAQLDALLAMLRKEGVADDAIYFGGYDEGGQLALDYTVSTEGFTPAGLVLVSAGLPPWELPDLGDLRGVRAFVAHGSHDLETARIASKRLEVLLRDAGATAQYTEYPGPVAEMTPEVSGALASFIGQK